MTSAQREADQAWREYVLAWLDEFAADAGIPLVILRTGRALSRRVSPIRDVCAFRLHHEVGLSLSQIAWALNAYDRSVVATWVRRGRAQAGRMRSGSRPPGVPDSRPHALRCC